MALALFDCLTLTSQQREVIYHENNREAERRLSIQTYLTQLLNARQGSIAHLPDYVLPDISEVYAELPYSQQTLIDAIHRVIAKYEPRLQKVQVNPIQNQGHNSVLSLEINAEIAPGETLCYGVIFESGGAARVVEWS